MPTSDDVNDDNSTSSSSSSMMDITDLLRSCATQCLSHSGPFTPLPDGRGGEHRWADGGGDDGVIITNGMDGAADSGDGALPSDMIPGYSFHSYEGNVNDDLSMDMECMANILEVQGIAIADDDDNEDNGDGDDDGDDDDNDDGIRGGAATVGRKTRPTPPPVTWAPAFDLRDAMTALELGDRRMDCCEIPLEEDNGQQPPDKKSTKEAEANLPTTFNAVARPTGPPRIAPRSLDEGTPLFVSSVSSPAEMKLDSTVSSGSSRRRRPLEHMATSPCPSLLPHWTNLTLSDALLLALVQLSALEAYVGTHNGGSNAAETLYCVLWCHDGVLADMEQRLRLDGLRESEEDGGRGAEAATAADTMLAQHSLLATTLGTIRIAESVRRAVVHADIYEEEDFGVALHDDAPTQYHTEVAVSGGGDNHGGNNGDTNKGNNDDDDAETNGAAAAKSSATEEETKTSSMAMSSASSSSMTFCPALEGSSTVQSIWYAAQNRLYKYDGGSIKTAAVEAKAETETDSTVVEALKAVLEYQRCFYRAVDILTDLEDYSNGKIGVHDNGDDNHDNGKDSHGNDNGHDNNGNSDGNDSSHESSSNDNGEHNGNGSNNGDSCTNSTSIAVREGAKTAAKLAKQASEALERLRNNPAVAKVAANWPLDEDGRLLSMATSPSEKEAAPATNASSTTTSHSLLTASFDPHVNRRLLGNAPVRKARFRSILDVLPSLSRVSSELEWAVCDVLVHADTLGRATRMLRSNSLRGCGGAVPPPAASVANKNGKASSGGSGGGGTEDNVKSNSSNKDGKKKEANNRSPTSPVGINVLSRSLLVLNLYFDDKLLGQYDFPTVIGQHMVQTAGLPHSLLSTRRAQSWLVRLAKPTYDTLKALCLNRHRERAFTESVLLPAYSALQTEATNVDAAFRTEFDLDARTTPSYATNYVVCTTMALMERHVGLGIEMGLYPQWYDLSTAYWYRDFLCSALLNVRGSIAREREERRVMELRIELEEREEEERVVKETAAAVAAAARAKKEAEESSQRKKNQKKGGGKKKGKNKGGSAAARTALPVATAVPSLPSSAAAAIPPADESDEDFEDKLDYTLLTVHRNICRGLVRYIAALHQAGRVSDPPFVEYNKVSAFTSQRKRFEKRFEIFRDMPQPPKLTYDDYIKGSDFSMVQSADLLVSATDCFRTGRSIVDRLLEVIVVSPPTSSSVSFLQGEQRRDDDDLYIPVRRAEIVALAKVCVTNSLFLHKVSSSSSSAVATKDAKGKVCIDFNAHKQYCTLSI